jgi:mono/diheme cytochrome c family protein
VNSCIAVDFPLAAPERLSCIHVTEIPEHLLKRSKAAKAKADGAEPAADAPAAASTAPATTAAVPAVAARAAAPVAPAAPVVLPDIPVVAAYKARKKVPVWAMVTLSILPVWMFMYVLALKPVIAKATGPLGDGAKAYGASCVGCHGAAGEGIGSAYAFTGGSVMKTFPRIEDQLRWVSYGTAKYRDAGISVYGNPAREGGVHITGASGGLMPGWRGNLSDADILAAVCHERYDLGGGDVASDEYLLWCAPDSAIYASLKDGSATFDTLHTKFADKKIMEIGPVPKAGSSKG